MPTKTEAFTVKNYQRKIAKSWLDMSHLFLKQNYTLTVYEATIVIGSKTNKTKPMIVQHAMVLSVDSVSNHYEIGSVVSLKSKEFR